MIEQTFYLVHPDRAQHAAGIGRLTRTMSLSHPRILGVARVLLLILGAYLLIEVLLPAVIAAEAATTV